MTERPAADNEPMADHRVDVDLERPGMGQPGERSGYSRIEHSARAESMIRSAEAEHSNRGIMTSPQGDKYSIAGGRESDEFRESRLGKSEMSKPS